MASFITWIKNQISYLIQSINDLFKGLILFLLIISGLASAILVRLAGQSGILISVVGIIVEIFALIGIYFLFRKYLQPEEKDESQEIRKK